MNAEPHQKVSINVHLGGRMYPLTIQVNQEDLLRNITREMNERIGQLQVQDGYKDKQDCIAIAAMSWALDFAITQQSELAATKEILTELTSENEKFAAENAKYKAQTAALTAKTAQIDTESKEWNKNLREINNILDQSLQK